MTELISQTEGQPEAWPVVSGVTGDLLAACWQRIEHYISWRFAPREVVWIVEGDGDWCPPLGPLDITAEEIWQGSAWVSAEGAVFASPYGGYRLTRCATFRFTGAGEGPAPVAVTEAVKRLAAYMQTEAGSPSGVNSYSANVGQLAESFSLDPAHMGRALQNSGAADLLRPYRRV